MFRREQVTSSLHPSARDAVHAAAEVARSFRHPYIGPEHLLLAVAGDDAGSGARLLRALGADPARVRLLVEERSKRGTQPAPAGGLPFTSFAKKSIELAMRHARDRGSELVDDIDLLLGITASARGVVADVLATLGVDHESLQRACGETIAGRASGAAPEAAASIVETLDVRIDDASSRSIYEQVVAQIQEAVATRRVAPGSRLPTVRQLADHLDIAPGTVARAYGELERLGIVITEGARGTRVADRQPGGMTASDRPETLVGLLRPVAVAAFHLGAGAQELRDALERAMRGIFGERQNDRSTAA